MTEQSPKLRNDPVSTTVTINSCFSTVFVGGDRIVRFDLRFGSFALNRGPREGGTIQGLRATPTAANAIIELHTCKSTSSPVTRGCPKEARVLM